MNAFLRGCAACSTWRADSTTASSHPSLRSRWPSLRLSSAQPVLTTPTVGARCSRSPSAPWSASPWASGAPSCWSSARVVDGSSRVVDESVSVEEVGELPELLGEVLAFVVWFLFGAVLVPVAVDELSPSLLLYALLSLTLVRLLPVALALVGTGLDRGTILFVGWFGPRGLASVVFALLAVEELGETSVLAPAIAAVALTVLLSVVLHGVSAGPLGRQYVRFEKQVIPATAMRARRAVHHGSRGATTETLPRLPSKETDPRSDGR